jgi:hypothetical protein
MVLSASWVQAQQAAAGPPVAVLKYGWDHSQIIDVNSGIADPAVRALSPVPTWPAGAQGGYDPPRSRARRTTSSIIPTGGITDDVEGSPGSTLPRREFYTYTLRLRNSAERAILAIEWEYVIVDPHSRAELARLKFRTIKKIRPGKTQSLTGSTRTPPTRTMSVQGLHHKSGPEAGESIEILRIQYADGSLWLR